MYQYHLTEKSDKDNMLSQNQIARISPRSSMKMSVSVGKRFCPKCKDTIICDIKDQKTEHSTNGIITIFKESITCIKCMTKYNLSYESAR